MSDFYLYEFARERDAKWLLLVEQIQRLASNHRGKSKLTVVDLSVSQVPALAEFRVAVEDPAFEEEWDEFQVVMGQRSWDTAYLQLEIPGDGHTFYSLQRDLANSDTSITGSADYAIIYKVKKYWLYNIFTLDASFSNDILPVLEIYAQALQALVRSRHEI